MHIRFGNNVGIGFRAFLCLGDADGYNAKIQSRSKCDIKNKVRLYMRRENEIHKYTMI